MIEKTPRNRILVVDDDESVLSFLSFSLQGEGFDVIEAPTAETAWQKLEQGLPDLILLDIMLPRIDGFTLCKQLRTDPRFENIPVLFITAYAQPDSLERTREAGAQGLIEKPLMFGELLVQVMDALNGKFSLPLRLQFGA